MLESISVGELKTLLDAGGDDVVLLDVRMPQEAEIATIPGAVLVPLDQIENGSAIEQVRQLAAGKRLYAHCKLGGRSAKALIALKREGIEGINVSGGIDAWSQEIDSSVQRTEPTGLRCRLQEMVAAAVFPLLLPCALAPPAVSVGGLSWLSSRCCRIPC